MRTVEEQVRDGTFVNIEGAASIGILNVGEGDTKLVFDKNNPAECIRAARIVKDMIRRGYALMIEVDQGGGIKTCQRVYDFKEDTFEYIIADLDPIAAADADRQETTENEEAIAAAAPPSGGESPQSSPPRRRGRPRLKNIPATGPGVKAVAIPNRAGG